jgi:dTDP-4-dehydrorhamnose reductase
VRILCLGRTGQVAQALVQAAAQRPHLDLTAAGRDRADLMQPGAGADLIAATRPDLVINAAAWTAVDRAESEPEAARRLNALAVGEVAQAAEATGARLVHLSTDYVFAGGAIGRGWHEDDPTLPASVYGRTKLEGEQLALAACPRTTVLRIAWVFAPWGSNFVRTMLRLAAGRDEIRVVDDQTGGPSYAPDIASVILDLAEQGLPAGVFHLPSGPPVSWAGLARAVFAGAGARGGPVARVAAIPSAEYPTPAPRPRWSVLDGARLKAATGACLPDWPGALDRCLDEIVQRGWDAS